MVEIHLGYFKQGDDLNHCLQDVAHKSEAFYKPASLLKDCVAHLHDVGVIMRRYKEDSITVEADTHCITVDGPENMLKELVDKKLAVEMECGCGKSDEEQRRLRS